jgi:signal peptidase I
MHGGKTMYISHRKLSWPFYQWSGLVGGIFSMGKQNGTEGGKSLRTSAWWEYIKTIALAFVLVFGFMRPFVVEAFKIPSGSMEDTLLEGDRILVAKFIYGIKLPFTESHILDFHKPEVGDVFVFKPPPGAGRHNLVKRIVGVPGDIIEVRNGNLYRNGEAVVGEDYVKRYDLSPLRRQDFGPVRVPPGHVFAMGDNRDLSKDSRAWGFVSFENIMGQTFLIYWSWDGDGDWFHKLRFSRIGRRVK